MVRFTFLTEGDCFYGDNILNIIKKRGTKAALTDFARLLSYFSFNKEFYVEGSKETLADRTGNYCTVSYTSSFVRIVDNYGFSDHEQIDSNNFAARPVIQFSSKNIPNDGNINRASDGVLEVEYGFYPQQVVSAKIQNKLEKLFENQLIKKTGNTFTVDSVNNDEKFSPKIIEEYEYQGKRYVRVIIDVLNPDRTIQLSNDVYYENDDAVWIEVQPVKWWVDEDKKIMVSEKILFSGIKFHYKNIAINSFEDTNIKKYMDNFFSKDLLRTRNLIQTKSTSINKSGLFSLIKNRFNKQEIEPVEIIEKKEEPQIEKIESLKDIMENIDFLLVKLGQIDKDLQIAKTKEYENMLDSENKTLTLYPFLDKSLESFRDDLKIIVENLQIKNESILECLNSMINEYNLGETPQTLSDIDKLYETFESSKDKYPLTTQRKFIFDLGLLYIYEIYENRNNITVERVNNSYFRNNLKIILVRLNELINSGIVENNFVIDFDEEVTVDYVLECIKKIKFIKNKKEMKKI